MTSDLPWPEGWVRPGWLARHRWPSGCDAESADGGVRFGVRPTSKVVASVLLVAGIGLLTLAAAVVAGVAPKATLGTSNAPNSTFADGSGSAIVAVVVSGLLGLVFVIGGVAGLLARRTGLGIVLTPEALAVDLGGDRVTVPWSAIGEIASGGYRIGMRLAVPVQNWTVVKRHDGSVATAIVHTRLRSDPVLVFHALSFYHLHSEARPELTTEQALSRIRAHDVVG